MRWISLTAAISLMIGVGSAAALDKAYAQSATSAMTTKILVDVAARDKFDRSTNVKLAQNTGCRDDADYNSCQAECTQQFNIATENCGIFGGNLVCLGSNERVLEQCVSNCARTYCN